MRGFRLPDAETIFPFITTVRRKAGAAPGRASGVIYEIRVLPGAVVPAKAGAYSARHWKCAADGLDSRSRGNDHCFKRDRIPNDTTIPDAAGFR